MPTIPDPPSGSCAEGDLIVLTGICDGGDPPNFVLGWLNSTDLPDSTSGGTEPLAVNGRKTLLERFQEQHRCTQERIDREKKKAKRKPRA